MGRIAGSRNDIRKKDFPRKKMWIVGKTYKEYLEEYKTITLPRLLEKYHDSGN